MTEIVGVRKDLTSILKLDDDTRRRYRTCLETLGFMKREEDTRPRDLRVPRFGRRMDREEALHKFLFLSQELMRPYGITTRSWRKLMYGTGRPVRMQAKQVLVTGENLPILEYQDEHEWRHTYGYRPEVRFAPQKRGDLGARATLWDSGEVRDGITFAIMDAIVTAHDLKIKNSPQTRLIQKPATENYTHPRRALITSLEDVPRIVELSQEYCARGGIEELGTARAYLTDLEEQHGERGRSLANRAHQIGCKAAYRFLEPAYRQAVERFVRRRSRGTRVVVTVSLLVPSDES